ncbi:MAG TPA: phosphatidylglycerol lysyltransferase domain-containing protein [Segeticoccus sp.]|uniref:phosphatidylglycerol lysyltransferase domain-containing protein n=1 Tax=Segeticoccus sp. TaxID=2706531 RepID=UPI002D7EF3DF|nr:phosphatidylglycerol lysyltransferase domain-containing protein [Segeticoccus sp.]HET8602279.1 phosphatidylglycerol lysyltransferase domain-containing protein [Segeticoccus sp.]
MRPIGSAPRTTTVAARVWRSGGPQWAPVWVARAAFVVGLLGIVGAALPVAARLDIVPLLIPPVAPAATRAVTIATGLLLLMLARGLRRRKRRAWLLAVVLTAAEAVLHLARDLDLGQAILTALLLALLVVTRAAFTGRPDPRSGRNTVVVFVTALLVAIGVGYGAILLDADGITGTTSAGEVTEEVLLGLVGVPGPLAFDHARHADFVAITLALLGAVVVLVTLAAALRPAGGPHGLSTEDEARLRALLAGPGPHDSLGYFALRREKSAIFSPTGKAAIGYRVIDGVSLAAGDPLGDPEAWPGVIEAWLDEARRYAWIPAVLAPSERGAAAYHRAGLDALELGDEAIVHTGEFTLKGRAMRGVRQAVGRARRAGYTVDITPAKALTEADLAEAQAASDRWREGTTERGFAMALGRLGDPDDTDCVLVRCRDADGALIALLSFVPWGSDGLSLDLMRRDPESDNGIVELMVTDLLTTDQLPALRRVSLNFAVFRSVFDRGARLGAGPVLRLWRSLLLSASRFWQIESLYRANAKYQPEWKPRYLCFVRSRDLPQVTIAALRAEAFLTAPAFWRRLRQGRRAPVQPDDPRIGQERGL